MANSGIKNGFIVVTDAPTSRTNLGVGTISTLNSPLPVANGGRGIGGAISNYSIFYGNSGVFQSSFLRTNGYTIISNVTSNIISTFTLSQSNSVGVTTGVNIMNLTCNSATISIKGSFLLASNAEAVTGTDTNKAIVPSSLTARLASPGIIGSTTPAAGTFTVLELGTVGGVQFLAYSGDPNGIVTAPQGSWCTNIGTPGGLVDRVFINTDGGTTWTGITSVA